MSVVKPKPCAFCPYRKDCPSGVWGEEEYAKLSELHHPMSIAHFNCHATEEPGGQELCRGWLEVSGRLSLGLRMYMSVMSQKGDFTNEDAEEIFEALDNPCGVEFFETGQDACEHGLRDIFFPSREAFQAMDILQNKYQRLNQPKNEKENSNEE